MILFYTYYHKGNGEVESLRIFTKRIFWQRVIHYVVLSGRIQLSQIAWRFLVVRWQWMIYCFCYWVCRWKCRFYKLMYKFLNRVHFLWENKSTLLVTGSTGINSTYTQTFSSELSYSTFMCCRYWQARSQVQFLGEKIVEMYLNKCEHKLHEISLACKQILWCSPMPSVASDAGSTNPTSLTNTPSVWSGDKLASITELGKAVWFSLASSDGRDWFGCSRTLGVSSSGDEAYKYNDRITSFCTTAHFLTCKKSKIKTCFSLKKLDIYVWT